MTARKQLSISDQLTNMGRKIILYIDDDLSSRRLITEIIDGHTSCKVVAADSLSEALQDCNETLPSLIFLDMDLPGTNGYEVMNSIRQEPPLSTLPVVALSGHAFSEDIDKAISTGFADYLTKPIDIGRLIDTVERFAGRDESG